MKKILALAAAAALVGGVSVWAANPFSDVSTSDWAYQAVSDLSDQGIVEGYPDGTFKGQTNITRYEMAQIVARLMAKEDQYNAEQRATIDKLAGEYADELDSLGVRVGNLEKKVGNISWSGDARMRYQSKDNSADESWNGRLRITAKAQVNDSTTVTGRLSTDNVDFKNGKDADVSMEALNVNHKFGKAAEVTLGRYGYTLGNQGGWLYGSAWGVDGAQATFHLAKGLDLTAGYGQLNTAKSVTEDTVKKLDGKDFAYAKAKANLGFASVGIDYLSFQDAFNVNGDGTTYSPELLGVNLTVPVGDFRVYGEYWNNTTAASDYDTAWNAGIGYGKLNLKKAGTWTLDLAYNDVDKEVYMGDGSGLNTDIFTGLAARNNISFWNAIGEVTLAQNTYLHAEYAFAADAETGTDPEDTWAVSLNYKF